MYKSAWMAKGEPWTLFLTPRLWRTVKYEEVSMHEYTSPREARQALTRYFALYNHERLHQALDYQTPAAVYFRKARATSDEGKRQRIRAMAYSCNGERGVRDGDLRLLRHCGKKSCSKYRL